MRAKDLTGVQFGKLLVEKFAGSTKDSAGTKRRFWQCRCVCGKAITILAGSLLTGNSTSCGCSKKYATGPKNVIHGMSKSPEYRTWAAMLQRCYNPKSARYLEWGGRGITVCDRWKNSFENFLADMGKKPTFDHSIDRENNDGNYEPGNCRWATRSQQQLNKRPPNTLNLTRGEDHWTRKDRQRARRIGAKNIKASHGKLADNNNSKLTKEKAEQMKSEYIKNPSQAMTSLGSMFGVGRETARKVVRGLLW